MLNIVKNVVKFDENWWNLMIFFKNIELGLILVKLMFFENIQIGIDFW